MAETWPNKIYQYAAQTDRLDNTLVLCTLPTIWDRLAAAECPARYYFNDVPFVALWGLQYLPISRPYANSSRRGRRHAAGSLVHRSALHRRGERHVRRRSPARRHPQRREVHGGDLSRRDHEPGLVAHGARLHVRRVGWFFDHVPPPLGRSPGGSDGRQRRSRSVSASRA
jgi:hypothetical protein